MTTVAAAVEVTAHRRERGWALHVADEQGERGVLLARRLSGVEPRVRRFVAAQGGVDPGVVEVRLGVRFDSWLDGEIAAVRAQLERAERTQREAAVRSRRLALQLHDAGLSGADIAIVLQLSAQRVSQLVRRPR